MSMARVVLQARRASSRTRRSQEQKPPVRKTWMPHSLKMARISAGTPLVSPVADARERHGQGCLPISHFLGTGPGALPSPYSTQSGGKNSHLNSPPLSSPTGIRYQVSGVVEVPGFRYEGSGITNRRRSRSTHAPVNNES